MAIIILLAALSGTLAGCKKPGEQETVDKLLAFLQNGEYPRIYQLLTAGARSKITLVDLSKRYDDIYKAIGLQKASCELTAIETVDDSSKTASFTMTMTAAKLGQFTLSMKAPLLWENGKWLVDWTSELILPGLGEGDKVQFNTIPADRGEIFDATGEVLAKNDYALSVYVDNSKVKNYETLIRMLAPQLGMTESDIRSLLDPIMKNVPGTSQQDSSIVPTQSAGISQTKAGASAAVSPSPSSINTPLATAAQPRSIMRVIKAYPQNGLTETQQQKLLELPGVGIANNMTKIRTYPFGDLLAQTLGYTGKMSQDDLTKPENAGLPNDAIVGKVGLEKSFEQYLRGQPGYELVIMDSNGNRKTTLAHKAGYDGKDLRLTIDINLQQSAEIMLRQCLSPKMAGSVIVLDPKTGYIQAMANAPSFDPNIFSFPVDPGVMKTLNDPASMNPFVNRATEGRYPPGSTFKPFTASMGLLDGVINTSFVFPYEIKNNYWMPSDSNWVGPAIKRKDATPGALNLQNAITYSDNIYFAYTAMKVGKDKFYQHCLDLGFTTPMKFDLPLKTSSISKSGKIESLRSLADSGYGQGELLITPMQMAALFGSLDNGGDIMLPRLVKSICHADGPSYIVDKTITAEVWKQGVVPQYNLSIILPYLKRVAQIGTASALNTSSLRQYEICAKTGTAEIGNDKTREIAWLMGFTTKKMDRLVCVTVEVPVNEGGIRTNIAKAMFEAPKTTIDSVNGQ